MKVLIDKWFTDNYSKLHEITSAWIVRTGRNIDAECLISNAYIYVLDRKTELSEEDIPRWVYSYINVELTYPKSVTNYHNMKHDLDSIDINDAFFLLSDQDLDCEIEINDVIESFKTTLDRYDQIIWDVYVKKGKTTKSALAEHFQIDQTSAFFLIRDIKAKFKEYVKTEERI